MRRVEFELSDERPEERERLNSAKAPSFGLRLWRRISENSAVIWPLAYLCALIWLGIALTRHSPLDFVVIAVWCLLGTINLAVHVRRARRRDSRSAADTDSSADEADGRRRSDLR
jgi:hypothetical protein